MEKKIEFLSMRGVFYKDSALRARAVQPRFDRSQCGHISISNDIVTWREKILSMEKRDKVLTRRELKRRGYV